MDYICPVCKKAFKRDVDIVIPHMEGHIVDVIKNRYPKWVEKDGVCRKCYTYYKEQMHPGEQPQKNDMKKECRISIFPFKSFVYKWINNWGQHKKGHPTK